MLAISLASTATITAPNVLTLQVPPPALARAKRLFDEGIRPFLREGLMQSLEQRPLPCAQLQTAHGNFFAMQPGGSSDPSKVGLSDLTWISVDDLPTWDIFYDI